MILDIDSLIAESHRMAENHWNNRKLSNLGDLLPEEQDKSVLFRHNWLAVGQAFGLVASSGVGKSSMADQMAFHWTMGCPFLAEPTRPLKISIIQAEDSDRDLQEQRDGMIRGLALEGFDEGQIKDAINSVAFPTDFIGVQGDNFLQKLTEYQGDCHFDMIFINPLQRFFGGDISSQEDVSHFCAGLDQILKHHEYGCTMGIVMHTPKFHSGIKDGRQSVDDYAEYAMAGSQEWTAWIRAVINFQKHGTSEDYFDIKASKRGKRLGWKDADGNPITKRLFKHSDGFIYWQEVTDPNELASIPEAPKKTKENEPFSAADCATQMARELARLHGFGSSVCLAKNKMKKALYEMIKLPPMKRTFNDADSTVEVIWAHPSEYGVEVVKHPMGWGGETLKLVEFDN